MLMLSVEGWLNGFTALGIFVIGWILGIFFIYQSRKTHAKLLTYLSLFLIFSVIGYWGVCLDFFTIALTGTINYPLSQIHENLRNSFVFIWVSLIALPAIYIGSTFLTPKNKKYVLSLIAIVGILYSLFIFFDPQGSTITIYPDIQGESMALGHVIYGTPAYFLGVILLLTTLIFNETGFLIEAKISKGIIRKKFVLLSIGFFLIMIMVLIEGTISKISVLIFTRIILIISFWIMYLGLREEPEKSQEPIKKEIKVEGDLFRISKKPDEITDEEVIYYKEQEICLVCKGKASKFTYICSNCRALYCANCAQALASLENQCWACDTPIDESKPVKPYKKDEEEVKPAIKEDEEKF